MSNLTPELQAALERWRKNTYHEWTDGGRCRADMRLLADAFAAMHEPALTPGVYLAMRFANELVTLVVAEDGTCSCIDMQSGTAFEGCSPDEFTNIRPIDHKWREWAEKKRGGQDGVGIADVLRKALFSYDADELEALLKGTA